MAAAKKATKKSTSKKSTAKKATSTAKKATKKATSTAKKATKKASSSAKKATKKASSSAKKATKSASSALSGNVVVASKVKEAIKQQDVRMSSDFVDALNEEVAEMVAKAAERAKGNGRSTVRPGDL
jgi:hypothetical protein